jgi:signal transduction histidine kinase
VLPLLERVVGHLERVRRIAEKEVVDREVPLDYDRFEAFVLEELDRAANGESRTTARVDQQWLWKPKYLRAFLEDLHWGLLDGVGARWTSTERLEFIEAAVIRATWFEAVVTTTQLMPSRARLLDPLVESAHANVGYSEKEWRDRAPWNFAVSYCDRLGLTGASASGVVTSPAGSMLVRLRGIDRLRWLLAIETSLATSDRDSWCIDLGSVRHLAQRSSWMLNADPVGPPISDSTFGRWTELGPLEYWTDEDYGTHGYDVTPIGQELFGVLASNDATSFRVLARALLEDDRERILANDANAESPDRATAATLRHARMVAHEVRNTLGPIQYALKKVWASPAIASADLSEPRQWIDEGFARLHQFIDDSLRLIPTSANEATAFSVMEVIDEARRQCVPGPERGIQIATLPASADPRCLGHRGRLVVALLNLLRNAVQAGAATIRVSVDARKPRTVTIRVHDDGPGIPPVQWDTLFANGVSHRDGGAGHGLSFVRLVIEQEMGGRVQPVPPPDGVGACFELELTTEEAAK